MEFLSQGDYNFPFTWPLYWAKHVYMWSYQSGTPDPDGFIRLPARILNFIVFALFGHMAVSYFYALSTLIIAAVSFYIFGRLFLKIQSRGILLLGSFFFALNPLFLGNLAKVGLVLSASMLPLCLVTLQLGFAKRQFRYFVLCLVFLNLSLMHPYTFIVNAAVSGLYFCWLTWQNRTYVMRNTLRFVAIGALAILLNAYFILPIVSLGSVSKDIISDNVVPTQTDYTSLVSYSNTGDILTGLSLAKNVFLDFSFYNGLYQPLYLLGIFGFYVLLIVTFLSTDKFLYARDKRAAGVMLAAFLLLIILAATMIFGVNDLIKILINLPGGWAFRSPLKWQLYIPLPLFGILVLLLHNMDKGPKRRFIVAGLVVCFVLMNSYLFYDIYKMLLVPRSLTHFSRLATTNMNNKTLLYINSPACMDFTQANPRIVTELNQVFVSKNLQVKRVLIDDLPQVNIGSYDYVLSCENNLSDMLTNEYNFLHRQDFVGNTFQLYENHNATPEIYAMNIIYALRATANVGTVYHFAVTMQSNAPFGYISTSITAKGVNPLADIFGAIAANGVHAPSVVAETAVNQAGTYMLNVRPGAGSFYVKDIGNGSIRLSAKPTAGFQPLLPYTPLPIVLDAKHPLRATYTDANYNYQNLIHNASFEAGPWQKQVGDCYAFDDQPKLSMRLDRSQKTAGKQSLALSAASHIACTSPGVVAVSPGAHYLLGFDYNSTGNDNAGLHVMFDNQSATNMTRRLQTNGNSWQHYSEEFTVPAGATHVRLMLYAYPGSNAQNVITHYDNVSLVQIPPLQNQLYLTRLTTNLPRPPAKVQYATINPTKRTVHITAAHDPFYLASSESYHPLWQLALSGSGATHAWSLTNQQASSIQHVRLNNTMNAWYIDPAALCHTGVCRQESDGSYDIDLTMQFLPQHWFYAGAAISSVAWAGTIGYFAYVIWKKYKRARRYRA